MRPPEHRGLESAWKADALCSDRPNGTIEEPIKELNAFLAQHVVSGAMHRWFHRTFNMGDAEDFAWNKGGRLYSDGKGSYQNVPRPQRLKMTIDGEQGLRD